MADSLNDLLYKYYSAVVTGAGSIFGAINVSRAAVGVEATTSVTAYGADDDAAAAATIAATPDLSAGTWEVNVYTLATGTVSDTEAGNMKFHIGATPVATILTPIDTSTGHLQIRVNLAATAPVSVRAAATATVGSKYHASIVASKIGY
jgi:hypothetical protein